MNPLAKLAIFSGVLALLFAGGALAGQVTDPGAPGGGGTTPPAAWRAMAGWPRLEAGEPVRGLAVADRRPAPRGRGPGAAPWPHRERCASASSTRGGRAVRRASTWSTRSACT